MRRTLIRAATVAGLTAGAWLAFSLASTANAQSPLDEASNALHGVSGAAGQLVGDIADTASPMVGAVTQVAAPVVQVAAPVAEVVTDIAAPVTQDVTDIAAPVVNDVAAPVGAGGLVVESVADVVLVADVSASNGPADDVTEVVVADVVAPAGQVLDPIVNAEVHPRIALSTDIRFAASSAAPTGPCRLEAATNRAIPAVDAPTLVGPEAPTAPRTPAPPGAPGCPGNAGGTAGTSGSPLLAAIGPAGSSATVPLIAGTDRDHDAALLSRADEPGTSPA